MAYFDRGRSPVIMEVGPVLDLEDVLGGKVCALASRAYERDYVDTAAALERYTADQLIGFAKRPARRTCHVPRTWTNQNPRPRPRPERSQTARHRQRHGGLPADRGAAGGQHRHAARLSEAGPGRCRAAAGDHDRARGAESPPREVG
jgi:hypothetical protein